MVYINTQKPLDVPLTIAHCPECQGALYLDISEYTEDGEITEGGFDICCENEEADPDSHYERWIWDWGPVETDIYQWLLDNVRVADATEDDLAAWNEAIKDWRQDEHRNERATVSDLFPH